MNRLDRAVPTRQQGAALLIVLAFVVLLTGVSVAYLSRTTSDRQVAHSSFYQSNVDQLAQSAMDSIIGDLRQEIANGSTAYPQADGSTLYIPTSGANMVPQRSGNTALGPNLIRLSIRSDTLSRNPAPPSRASAVNSTTDAPASGRFVTLARWNTHYLLPKANTLSDDSYPPSPLAAPFNPYTPVPNGFTPPDWVFVTPTGGTVITAPNTSVIGRYAYVIYAEGGLLDANVAGYPTGTTVTQVGRKGSVALADLRHLCPTGDCNAQDYGLPNPNAGGAYQIDRLVGWRNYATTQPTNNFPNPGPPANQAFAYNFRTDTGPATLFYNYVLSNGNGFLSPSTAMLPNHRTDQMFVQRQELIAFRSATQFSSNALQYLSTFTREANSPSFSPSTPTGSSIDYAALANTPTAVNPNFLSRRVTTSFTRFDGTTAIVGEPLVKTRFPLSRLAWITYKGPSAGLVTTDPVYQALSQSLVNSGESAAHAATIISAGTANNIKRCFGLTFPAGGTPGSPWTYTNPAGTSAATRILRLDEVAAAGREPDFFELLQAAILSGSLGQNTGGGVTGGNVFPDIHMSSTTQHILSIGAAIIDQADPDSVPTRIQFNPSGTVWTAYGMESLPYITQLYPIAGTSPNTSTQWATYLLFQLWNPHQNAPASPPAVRLRVDGHVGIFTGGNGQAWTPGSPVYTNGNAQSVTVNPAAFSVPAPLTTANVTSSVTWPGTQGTFTAVAPPPAVPTPTP